MQFYLFLSPDIKIMNSIKLIDQNQMQKMITRISHEIVESCSGFDNVAIIGIKTRGEFLANRIKDNICEISKADLPFGTIDITFHRDDFSDRLIMPKLSASDIPFDVSSKQIFLVDDVLYTGRTIRAAIDEIFSYGRAEKIKLAVLVDRGHRELPIRPDFVGKNFPTNLSEHIIVKMSEIDKVDEILKVVK